jgi:hypothetical protein
LWKNSPKRQLADPTFLSFHPFSEGKKDISFIAGAPTATWQGNHRGRPFAVAAATVGCGNLLEVFPGYEAFL